jgi:tetratricopeptide (TPR) repeat protein
MPTRREEAYDEAIALQQQGALEEAIGAMERLVAREPDYALAHAALSVFYGRVERYEESVRHGREVCRLEPDDPFSFVAMSLLCQKAGKIAEAEQAMLQARQVEFAARRSQGE